MIDRHCHDKFEKSDIKNIPWYLRKKYYCYIPSEESFLFNCTQTTQDPSCDNCGNKKHDRHIVIFTYVSSFKQLKSKLGLKYRAPSTIMLVYDVTNRSTFDSLFKWANIIGNNSNAMKVVLVGNKCDLTDNSYNLVLESEPIERQVSYDEGLKFASKYEFTFFETSAKLGISVDAAFQTLATN